MRSNRTWMLALSSSILASCGSSPDSGGTLPVSTGAATTVATTTSAEPASSASATPIASPPPPPPAVPELPPIELKDATPMKLGKNDVRAIPCKLDPSAGPMKHAWNWLRSASVAVQSDHKVLLLDRDGKLRRYENVAKDGCELKLDPSFGVGGLLDLGEKKDEKLDAIHLDDKGVIYASGWNANGMLRRVVNGVVSTQCVTRFQRFYAYPTSPFATMENGVVSLANDMCTVQTVELQGLSAEEKETVVHIEPVSDALAAIRNKDGKFAISTHDTKGKLKARFDQKKEDAELCFAKRVTPCAAGICVLDTNCRKIAAWSPQGKFIGKVSFSPLLGVSNPLPQDMWIAPEEAYVVINAEAKSKDGNHVVLFRVLGL